MFRWDQYDAFTGVNIRRDLMQSIPVGMNYHNPSTFVSGEIRLDAGDATNENVTYAYPKELIRGRYCTA